MASPAEQFLSAQESDPKKLGWMQGFPPPDGKLLSATDGYFFTFPALRYSAVHMRQFPTAVGESRGLGAPVPLEHALDDAIDALTFQPWGESEPMPWEASLWRNYTDGMLILRRGKVVFERYFAELNPAKKHAAMSVTKSFTGTLAAMLLAEGRLDEHAPVVEYVPELRGSAFADATLRQVMDKTTVLDYSEDYSDSSAEVWQFSAAGNPTPTPSYDGLVGYFEYLQTVQKAGEHGEAFGYKTVNADALGWIVSRVAEKSIADLLADRVGSKLGMDQDAYYQIDSKGIPFAGGGSKEAFAKAGYAGLEGWSYRNMWWLSHNANAAFAARGVHGQTIYIDPTAEMVNVRFASHPVAANSASDPYSLPAYEAVARCLSQQ